MKFEFVEFYPSIKTKNKNELGTCHIYAIDCQLDIRGIKVLKTGKNMHFLLPHFRGNDPETKENISYPLIRWTKPGVHEGMIDWLHKEVKPKILELLKI